MIIRIQRIRFFNDGTWCMVNPAIEGPFKKQSKFKLWLMYGR